VFLLCKPERVSEQLEIGDYLWRHVVCLARIIESAPIHRNTSGRVVMYHAKVTEPNPHASLVTLVPSDRLNVAKTLDHVERRDRPTFRLVAIRAPRSIVHLHRALALGTFLLTHYLTLPLLS
jgi:hypothetical protein